MHCQRLCIILSFISLNSSILFAQNTAEIKEDEKVKIGKHFDGFYVGANIGSQNIVGGAFINDIDVISQGTKFVLDFSTGFRKQLLNDRILVGLEFQFGITDGNSIVSDSGQQLEVTYKNNTQKGWGLNIGTAIGRNKNFLVYAYLKKVIRSFEIVIVEGQSNFDQTDKESIPKYGLSLEASISRRFNIRADIGFLEVDFGDTPTQTPVQKNLDFTIGTVYQF